MSPGVEVAGPHAQLLVLHRQPVPGVGGSDNRTFLVQGSDDHTFTSFCFTNPAKSTILPPWATWKSCSGVWREEARRLGGRRVGGRRLGALNTSTLARPNILHLVSAFYEPCTYW